MAFQIGRIRQHQIGIGHHFAGIGIGIDDFRNFVLARLILVGQHVDDGFGVHRRVPRHVGHIHEQRVDLVGITGMSIGDHHMHQTVGRHRRIP